MLKRTFNLMPATVRRRVFALCILSTLILTVSLAACAGPKPSAQNPAPALVGTETPELTSESASTLILATTPTTFQITDLKINPAEVNPGEEFLITANLANAGDFDATQTIELTVNNSPRLVTEVTMPAGETGEFRVVGREPLSGTYIVNLGDLTAQFVVRGSAETLILSSPDPETAAILSSPDPETAAPDQNTSSGCGGCGGGSSGSSQGGCSGCGSSSSSQGGCGGCGG